MYVGIVYTHSVYIFTQWIFKIFFGGLLFLFFFC